MTEPDPLTTVSPTNAAMAFCRDARGPIAQVGERAAGEVRDRLVGGERFESASEIAVLDNDELVGLIQMDFLAAASESSVYLVDGSRPSRHRPGLRPRGRRGPGGRTPRKQPRCRRLRRAILGLIPGAHRMLGSS